MKTTVDIPDNELRDAMGYSGAKTKKEAIITALTDYNRRQRLTQLAEKLGTFEHMISVDELNVLRRDDS